MESLNKEIIFPITSRGIMNHKIYKNKKKEDEEEEQQQREGGEVKREEEKEEEEEVIWISIYSSL